VSLQLKLSMFSMNFKQLVEEVRSTRDDRHVLKRPFYNKITAIIIVFCDFGINTII
jgi:hypothetical protein